MENNREKGKKLLYGTFIYAIGTLGSKILSFLIVPLYTYYIIPADLGTFDLLQSTVNLLLPIISLQISDAAFVWMIQKKENNKKCISAVYMYLFAMSIMTVVLIVIINKIWRIPYCFYFIGMLLSGRWMGTIQKLSRGLKKQKLFALSGVIYTFVFLILNLFQIIVMKLGVISLFQSAIIANLVVIFFLIVKEKELRNLDMHFNDFDFLKSLLRFSIPIVPNQLNWWIVNSSDRYIIRYFLSNTANGIYSIAYKFPSVLQMIFTLFYQSWQDSALADKDHNEKFYSKIFRIYYYLGFSLLLPLIPFTKVFINLVMEISYREAASYISFLYLGTVFQAFSNFLGVGYLKEGKTKQVSMTTIYGAIINIAVNILLIKYIGLYAASISTFFSFFVVFFIRVYQTKNIMKIRIKWLEFFSLFVLTLIIVISSVYTSFMQDVILTGVGIIFFIFLNRGYINAILKKIKQKVIMFI